MDSIDAVNRNVKDMNTNMNSKFAGVQNDLKVLKEEMNQMKLDMVTKVQFEELETRVHKLEMNVVSAANPDMSFLQSQLERLDPAHKSISLKSFKGEVAKDRESLIQKFFSDKLPDFASKISIEHVYKGPMNLR